MFVSSNTVDPDFYEYETHILFDDAFKVDKKSDDNEQIVNDFVKVIYFPSEISNLELAR